MPDSVNLADEFTPPETGVKPSVNLVAEFDAPDMQEQHAVINDAAEKARTFKMVFDPALPQDKRQAAAQVVLAQMAGSFLPHAGKEGVDTIKQYWQDALTPIVGFGDTKGLAGTVPAAPEMPGQSIQAGAYNGVMPVIAGLSSPVNIATLGTFGALTKIAQGVGPAATWAKAGLTAIKTYFAAEMAKGAGETAGKTSVDFPNPDVSVQEKTTDVVATLTQSALAALAGHSATEIEPSIPRGAANPNAVKEALANQDQSAVQQFNDKLDAIPGGPAKEAPTTDYQYTVQRPQEHDGHVIPGYIQVDEIDNGQNVRSTNLEALKAEGVDLPPVPDHLPQGQYSLEQIRNASKADLASEFVPPEKGTEEAKAVQEVLDQKPPETTSVEPRLSETHTAPDGPTSVRNAIVDTERESRGLPPAMEAGKREFGTVWDEASKKLDENPNAGSDLVESLKDNARAVTDTENALLLHRQIDLQNQFDKLTDRVVNGAEGQTPETLAEDRIQLAKVSDDLLDIYNVGRRVGTETGRGLNARKMLANEDYSLAKMVTVRRAANEGRALTPEQSSEVEALHKKIADTQKAFDDYVARTEKASKGQRAVRSVVVKYISDRADEARARISARLEKSTTLGLTEGENGPGLLSKENLADFATVGADYLARGIDTFATWSEAMVKEFGDKITPHLKDIFSNATEQADDLAIEQAYTAKKERLEATIADLTKRVNEGDTSGPSIGASRPSVEEIEKLEQQRDALKNELSGMRKREQTISELTAAIAEKENKLAEGDLSPKGTAAIRPSTEAVEKLRQERDALNKDLAEARKQANRPTEEDRISGEVERLNKIIAEKEARIKSGEIEPKQGSVSRPQPKEIEQARQEIDALNKRISEARKEDAKPTEAEVAQKKLDSLNERIAEKKAALKSGDLSPARKELSRPQPEALEKARQELEALNAEIARARPKPEPIVGDENLTPEQRRLKSFKTRLASSAEDYAARTAAGDLGPRPKPEALKLDEEAIRLKAANERAKQEFQTAVIKDRLNNRSTAEKAQDTLIRWRRGFLLSGPITLAKLTGAAMLRVATTPLEELAGSGLAKALPGIFENAPRHGGLSSRAEAEAITSIWTKGIKDAGQKLRTAKSDLDVLFGKGATGRVRESDVIPQSLIDFFGNLHGALKAPVMRSEFERSLVKRMEFAIKEGVDVSDPLVQTKIAMDAYKDSQRAIFMQDNFLSKMFNTAVSSAENSKLNGGRSAAAKAAATTLRLIFPIVKVPTNIVAEAAEYAVGSITGLYETGQAYRKGIENLTPEQADVIARQLKKGSLGLAALAIGYFNRHNIGGLYQQGEHRKKDDLKPGETKIGGVTIGRALTHSSLMEVMQLGATVGRIEDEKVRGQSPQIHEAIGEATLGLLEELPFVRTPIELSKLFDKRQRAYEGGELVKGLVVPQALSSTAAALDKDAKGNPISRKPTTVMEHVKTGIPGLREQVRKR